MKKTRLMATGLILFCITGAATAKIINIKSAGDLPQKTGTLLFGAGISGYGNASAPGPATFLLLGAGLTGLALYGKRRKLAP